MPGDLLYRASNIYNNLYIHAHTRALSLSHTHTTYIGLVHLTTEIFDLLVAKILRDLQLLEALCVYVFIV